MQITLDLPDDIAQYVQTVALKTGKNQTQVTTDMLEAQMRSVINTLAHKNDHLENHQEHCHLKPHHVFNYDLERMKTAMDTEFIEMPDNLKSPDDVGNWLMSIAK